MAEPREVLTPAELDQMTPNQRAAAVRAGVVTDLAQLPADFRRRIIETARHLLSDTENRHRHR